MSPLDVFTIALMAFMAGVVTALQIAIFVTNRERLSLLRTATLLNDALEEPAERSE